MRTDGRTDSQRDRQTDTETDRQRDRQTNVTKLIVTFRNTANALKKRQPQQIFSLTKTIRLYQIQGIFATKHLRVGIVL